MEYFELWLPPDIISPANGMYWLICSSDSGRTPISARASTRKSFHAKAYRSRYDVSRVCTTTQSYWKTEKESATSHPAAPLTLAAMISTSCSNCDWYRLCPRSGHYPDEITFSWLTNILVYDESLSHDAFLLLPHVWDAYVQRTLYAGI